MLLVTAALKTLLPRCRQQHVHMSSIGYIGQLWCVDPVAFAAQFD